MKKFWFDFTNPPHVNFYYPFIQYYKKKVEKIICTARDFAETIDLLSMYGIEFNRYGKHYGKNKIWKIYGLLAREIKLLRKVESFDVSFSSNYESPLISWLRGKQSLVFDDNDISPNWLYSYFADYIISPEAIDKTAMYKMGIKERQLITYDGYKEDIYIADFVPDKSFPDKIPFDNFVTVRPENIFASYIPEGTISIVPDLISLLVSKGINVLYLPRYEIDKTYIKSHNRIFTPNGTLNGLDVCYYSDVVLTGAGTFSRESAVMGTPAVSFYAGKVKLGVDQRMEKEKSVYFSRNLSDIYDFVVKSSKKPFDNKRSKEIQTNLLHKIDEIIFN